jgi:hypothetical protein
MHIQHPISDIRHPTSENEVTHEDSVELAQRLRGHYRPG